MPKRKTRDDDDYDVIAKKLKELTKKLKKARPKRRRRILSTSSSSPARSPSRGSIASLIEQEDSHHAEPQTDHDSIQELEPRPSTSTAAEPVSNIETTVTETQLPFEFDEETLLILGEDPSIQRKYGKDIQEALAVRLQHAATMGLTKELRKELQEKHLCPANCTLIDAPLLNPEIKAAVSDIVAKRDKGIENKQKKMANAISCVADAATMLLSSEDKNPALLQVLMDAGRLMADCQYNDTTVRRNFILNSILKKDMKDQLQLTKVDKYLFGQDLADTLKSAKAICKSGAELKTNPLKPPPVRKPPTKPVGNRTYNMSPNLNWRAPPPSRRQPASWSHRNKEPAYPKGPPASSSRTSYSAPSRGRR